LPLGLLVEINRTGTVVLEGYPEIGNGGREGLDFLAIGLDLVKPASRVHKELLVHDSLCGGLGLLENDILALEVLGKILGSDFEDFPVQDGKRLLSLGSVDLFDVVIEGSFQPIELFLTEGLSLASLKVLDKELLKACPIFLTKQGCFDRRTGTIHGSLLIIEEFIIY
jgi:hypothetical protein